MTYDFNPFKKQLTASEEWLKREFQQIRTSQASPAILDAIKVDAYGAPMPIKELASVTIEHARTLRIAPWDKGHTKEIEKAIHAANLGVSVVVDDQGLRINFPALTEETRKAIAKTAKDKLEEARVQVRRERERIHKDLQAKEKDGKLGEDESFRCKHETQKLVDEANKKLEETYKRKEAEILG